MAEEKTKPTMRVRILAVLHVAIFLGMLITCFFQGFDAGSIAVLALCFVSFLTLFGPIRTPIDSQSTEPDDQPETHDEP